MVTTNGPMVGEWERALGENPKVLWGLVSDVVKAVRAGEGERRTGRRPGASVANLQELYSVLFPAKFETAAFPQAFADALGSKSQRTFAKEIGFNQATVSRLLAGKTPPTVESMERIAHALKLSPTYFSEYRAMKLGQVVTDVLLANPSLSVDEIRRVGEVLA